MQNRQKNAKFTAMFVLVLFMASALLMTNAQVEAQLSATQPTVSIPAGVTPNATATVKAYLSFRPNPVGVGQSFLVNLWTTPAPGANRFHPEYKVTITKPDGTKDILSMKSYVADGTNWFEYIADQVGTWKLKFEFVGTYFPAGRYLEGNIITATSGGTTYADSVYYKPSSTAEQTLTVQADMVYSWPETPLPTDYWTRPVPFEIREWWPILGNYPWYGPGGGPLWDQLYPDTTPTWNARSMFIPWVQGPNSAHVVWKQQGAIEGIVGGDSGYASLGLELSGWGGKPSIVYSGRAYQTYSKPGIGKTAVTYWKCYDIRTGELFWERPLETGESAPTVIEYGTQSFSGSGVVGADIIPSQPSLLSISGGYLRKYNAWTGAMSGNYSISPLTGSGGTYYMNGHVLGVQDLGTSAGADRYRLINWTTLGTSSNFTSRIASNTTYATSSLPGLVDYNSGYGASVSGISEGGAFAKTRLIGYNLKTGLLLWNITIDEPQYSTVCNIADHGKVATLSANGYWIAYDLATGRQAWKSETMDYPWDEPGFGAYGVQSAYGMLFRQAYSGVYAFDWDTGKIVWKFEAPALFPYDTSYITPDGATVYPFDSQALIVDGKMYVYNSEHTAATPYPRGWKTYCLNITTGECIWSVMIPGAAWFSSADLVASDGYLILGGADGYLYSFGKGKSATTVTAGPKTITQGASIVIEGTVLDQSPAQAGTPCVSKESMATYMEYLHRQMPIAGFWNNETITGVPVSLDAVDPNGNFIHIGDASTDGYSGTFGYTWEPEIQGQYTVTATFMGDDSYGSSFATTYVSVGEAPAATATPEPPEPAPDNTGLLYGIMVAVIVAIIIGIIAILVALRKR